jgi:hypothetical protein
MLVIKSAKMDIPIMIRFTLILLAPPDVAAEDGSARKDWY